MLVSLLATLKPPYHKTDAATFNKQEVHKTQPIAAQVEQPQIKEVAAVPEPVVETPAPAVVPAPVPEPAPVEIPKPQPVAHPKGCDKYGELVSRYNWNATVAINVMRAETGCNPSAVGDNYPINGVHAVSCGLFQIRTLRGRPSCEALQDPETNVAWAYKLYTSSGWQPWSVCKNKVSCY